MLNYIKTSSDIFPNGKFYAFKVGTFNYRISMATTEQVPFSFTVCCGRFGLSYTTVTGIYINNRAMRETSKL